MATPLRKDEADFIELKEITTEDLAQAKKPMSETRGPQAVPVEAGTAQSSSTSKVLDATPLFPGNELEGLRTRWKEVQIAFVDEPRQAVKQADGLVASAMQRLAEVFAEERSKLEQQWDRGDSVSTEDLRVAMQRYRTFFERLLSI